MWDNDSFVVDLPMKSDRIEIRYTWKTMSMVTTRVAQNFPPFLSGPFTRVFQRLRHKSPDPVEFRSGIQNILEIKLSFETCDRWEIEQRILAVYPYSIKRTSPVGVNKNKDTRIRKILLHLQQQAYGRDFSGFHSCVF